MLPCSSRRLSCASGTATVNWVRPYPPLPWTCASTTFDRMAPGTGGEAVGIIGRESLPTTHDRAGRCYQYAIRGVERGHGSGILGGVIGVILLRQRGRRLHQCRFRDILRRGRGGGSADQQG